MVCNEIKEVYSNLDFKNKMKDIQQVLSISISLANGMVWKEKTKSFYTVIAKELKQVFHNDLLEGCQFKKFKDQYLRVSTSGEDIIFQKNNLFEQSNKRLEKKEWLNQKLLIIENKKLPEYLRSKDKEKIFKNLGSDDIELINRNYNRQELNSDKFALNLIEEDKERITYLLDKYGYYSISVEEYINLLSTGNYNYHYISDNQLEKRFKDTFNNYILELGVYIAKELEDYLI